MESPPTDTLRHRGGLSRGRGRGAARWASRSLSPEGAADQKRGRDLSRRRLHARRSVKQLHSSGCFKLSISRRSGFAPCIGRVAPRVLRSDALISWPLRPEVNRTAPLHAPRVLRLRPRIRPNEWAAHPAQPVGRASGPTSGPRIRPNEWAAHPAQRAGRASGPTSGPRIWPNEWAAMNLYLALLTPALQ